MVFRASKTGGGAEVSWRSVHRSGLCEKCHTRLEDVETGKVNVKGKPITALKCPQCGHNLGELIVAQRKRGRWFMYFFGNWDKHRAAYCEKHRHDKLPVAFRDGKFSVSTILFTIKLKRRGEWDVQVS